jgi:molybdopterin molybdotransferase
MQTLEQALKIVLTSAGELGTEPVELAAAVGRILAQDVASDADMPPFDKAVMDGYACRRADLAHELSVVETIPAGYAPTRTIGANQCARIMTGGMVPPGADCVVMVEQTEQPTAATARFVGPETSTNIYLRGEDVKAGQVLLCKGARLKPQHAAVLAAVGCTQPYVFRRPAVGVISTGDELVTPADRPHGSQIRDSNSGQLCAQVEQVGAVARNYGIVADRQNEIEAVLRRTIAENDVVLLSGGVSAGDYDYVPQIMTRMGIDVLFHRVAIKPGKPTVFGVWDPACCFGLPGNPVSSFVAFELLVKPLLYRMMGHDYKPTCIRVPLAAPVRQGKTERQAWIPVTIMDDFTAEPVEYHGSAHITALCHTDGLIRIDTGITEIAKGVCVQVRLL